MSLIYHARMHDGNCRSCQHQAPAGMDELTGPVGEGGTNRADDVITVQARLNQVDASSGGPTEPLEEDGLCGPLTRAAILRFQRHYPELLKDGRIDVNKNTWKKLVALSDGKFDDAEFANPARAALPKSPSGSGKKAGPAKKPALTETEKKDIELLNNALFLSRHRIFESIKALDVAAQELTACEVVASMHVGPQPKSLHAAYQELQPRLTELPTVDRCFKVVAAKMTTAHVRDVLGRLRKMYVTMLDVIVRTMITTPAAEDSGSRRFIRTTTDAKMKKLYPPRGAIANAPQGGWWNKNANVHHMKYNTSNLNDGDVITTLIHEMSHFVSHNSIYQVGNHHATGEYNGAFNDNHFQAVRNSFCYEWYSFLASFKNQRSTPNSALVLT